MKRKAGATPILAVRDALGATVSSASQQEHESVSSRSEALAVFAEEFGRLLARRLLSDLPNRRRGYSLPELLLGALVMALIWLLFAHSFGWLLR